MYPPPPSSLLPFLDSARANAASVSLRIFASARSYRLDGRETGRDRCTRNAAAPKFQKPRDQPHPSSIATHGLDIPSFKSCPPKKPIITCRRADRSFRIPPSRMPTIMLVIFFIDFVEYVTLSSSFDDSFAFDRNRNGSILSDDNFKILSLISFSKNCNIYFGETSFRAFDFFFPSVKRSKEIECSRVESIHLEQVRSR